MSLNLINTAETITAFHLDTALMHVCPDPFEILFGWRVWVRNWYFKVIAS